MENRYLTRREMMQPLAAAAIATAVMAVPAAAKDKDGAAKGGKEKKGAKHKQEKSSAAGGDIDLKDVPSAVKNAADRALTNMKWQSAARHNDDDGEIYELLGEDAKGNSVSAEISADGQLTSAELTIDRKDVPKAVIEAAKARRAEFNVDSALATYVGDDIRDLAKAEGTYEVCGTTPKGKDVVVQFTAKGEVIEVKKEVALRNVPATVTDALKKRAPKFEVEIVHSLAEKHHKVIGYLFGNKKGTVAFVSSDGEKFEKHKEE